MFDAVQESLVTKRRVGAKELYRGLALRRARKFTRAGAMLARSQTDDLVEPDGNRRSALRFRSSGGRRRNCRR